MFEKEEGRGENRKRITFINNNRVPLDFPRLKEDTHARNSLLNSFLISVNVTRGSSGKIKSHERTLLAL